MLCPTWEGRKGRGRDGAEGRRWLVKEVRAGHGLMGEPWPWVDGEGATVDDMKLLIGAQGAVEAARRERRACSKGGLPRHSCRNRASVRGHAHGGEAAGGVGKVAGVW